VPDTTTNAATPAVASASPSVGSPKKKRNRKSKWTIVPWNQRGESRHPIFAPILHELLQRTASDFMKDPETGEWSAFMKKARPMAEFIAIRLIHAAANGDLAATRELIDRVDGAWNAKKSETTTEEHGRIEIGLMYEAPISERERYKFEAAQQLISLLPPEMAAKAKELLLKPERKFTREAPKHMQQALPAKSDAPGIEYGPLREKSAE
jgi:hypothetical protein